MSSISLRQYCEEMKGLIRQGALDEAIDVGRHILSVYPKYVSPYRLMGEAALEQASYDEAADLFRRVLGADPEDVVSHVALAVVHDESRALDEAIWHLEIAFELVPGNAEIRQELIRLYTERDGSPPKHLKLTPAALGRLYLAEGLYDRAVTELEPLLQIEPDRLDLSLAVAEALWRQDRRWEASEYYQRILADLPYSLKANLIQGALLLQGGRPDEARPHLERARALDPENVLAGKLFGEHSPLHPEPVLIARLGEVAVPSELPSEVQAPIAPEMPAFEPEPTPDEAVTFPHRLTQIESPPEMPAETPAMGLPETEPAAEAAEPELPVREATPSVPEPGVVLQDEPTWLVSLEQKAKGQKGSDVAGEGIPDWLLGLRGLSHEPEPSAEVEETEEAAEAVSEWAPVTDAEMAALDAELEAEPPAEPLPEWPSRAPAEEVAPDVDVEPPPPPEAKIPESPVWPSPPESPSALAEQPAAAPRSLSEPEEDLSDEGTRAATEEEAELLWPTRPDVATPATLEDVEDEAAEAEPVAEVSPPEESPLMELSERVDSEESAGPVAQVAPEEKALTETESLLYIARRYLGEGDLDASVEQYHRLVHGSTQVPPEAIDDLADLAGRSPDRLEIQQLLGDAYMRVGRLHEALRLYREIRSQLLPS